MRYKFEDVAVPEHTIGSMVDGDITKFACFDCGRTVHTYHDGGGEIQRVVINQGDMWANHSKGARITEVGEVR